jgi:Protein phosphatase 2C
MSMHTLPLRAFSVAKREDAPNEDRWRASDDGAICAVSDGASVSFDSATWAEVLTRRFVEDQRVSREWLEAAAREHQAAYDRDAMPWMYQAAYDRGSFATLLGVVFSRDGANARAFAVGDSLLAFIDDGEVVRTIPYIKPEQFENPPQLLSTSMAENRSLDEAVFSDAWHDLNISAHSAPIFLLLTDAIARWLLEEPSTQRISALLGIEDKQSFEAFVNRERSEGRLRRDDTTMVVIEVAPQ